MDVTEIINCAEEFRSKGQYEFALEKYTEAIAQLYASRGEVLGSLQKYENEIEDFKRALDMTTDAWLNGYLHFMLGLCYIIIHDYEKAIIELTIAIKERPSFMCFYARGGAFEKIGNYQAAKKDYLTTLELYPTHKLAKKALEGLNTKNQS